MNEAQRKPPPSFSPTQTAKRVLRVTSVGALGTLDAEGAPFASLVTIATTHSGEPILLISRLALHTQNIARDNRISLLLVAPGGEAGDPLAGARLTVNGRIVPADQDTAIARRFLASHPEATGYATFADFSFRTVTVEKAHLVAGFGRIVSLSRDQLLTDCTGAEELLRNDDRLIEQVNRDYGPSISPPMDGAPSQDWRVISLDPEGLDLASGTMRERYAFGRRLTTTQELLQELAAARSYRNADVNPSAARANRG